ncbi:Dihydroorotate dehydrogenase B (NAD(+)), electron transfer subunit [Caloramator mitchellensis]|uniref:Dihydroorotate dehydrogenase B (NAD(+)), electron transfer subunit n=1 Tax=Caloramator mitchellensis TaxID=908809 RepID=A0A0R3JRV8_CALMK|nr:dihydroorotate dehydrogenase electron transfer subunit [Caloramator mitchellensis]KRQ86235.1 Dihydroorotate dehydrogenase B (NAD(+)), electron transfer subunit [Caloramator mitchellensis]
MNYKSLIVKDNEKIAEGIYKLMLYGEYEVLPGQFFMLRNWDKEPILSRPFSIHDCDNKMISFIYQIKGTGTSYLSLLRKGDFVKVTGPLGNGMDTSNIKGKVALVGGGVGIAPLAYFAKKIKAEVDVYFGFRDESYGIDELKDYVENIHIATESGKEGHKGYVTDIFNPFEYSLVIACGPDAFMKKVQDMCIKTQTPLYLLLEKNMACGVGACLVCTCKTKDGMKRVCKDGPIFRGEEVVFDA